GLVRNFVATIQHTAAQLDLDSASHIAAMQGAIFAAAKIAHKAQEDAARAQQAAAVAREAAAEAVDWANRAQNWAAQAATSARQANSYADAAEKSARDAQASAAKASQAGATARAAARSANHSANRAVESARTALTSATRAQASAAFAYGTALNAGESAKEAAEAASQAHKIAKVKRVEEVVATALKAAEEAKAARDAGRNPADTPGNDSVQGGVPWWQQSARDLAHDAELLSIFSGLAGSGLTIAGAATLPEGGVGLVLEGLALEANLAAMDFAVLNALLTGIGYGWTSNEFQHALGSAALHVVTFGQVQLIKKLGGGKVFTAVTGGLHEAVSPITGLLHHLGF
ncbi:hypothetical protein ABZ389_38375, partial [Streptomyces sp. NPDC005877]